LDSSYRRRMYF